MHYVILFALLAAAVNAAGYNQNYSYSSAVGSGTGSQYVLKGNGRITAVRMWEIYNNYIAGIQLRYGAIWSRVAGRKINKAKEIELFDDEAIVQISGKYATYVQSLVFTTNRGRTLGAGQPVGLSYNMYPEHGDGELRFLSGRYRSYMTSIGAHWAVLSQPNATAKH